MQFNKFYSDSKVSVEERFSVSFDMNTFQQKYGILLTYKAYWVISETNLLPITSGDWIEFNDFSLSFSGQRSASYWLSKSRIRVVATYGYTSASNDFVIIFASLPFLYVFQFIIQIFCPILGVLGIYKQRLKYIYVYLKDTLCIIKKWLLLVKCFKNKKYLQTKLLMIYQAYGINFSSKINSSRSSQFNSISQPTNLILNKLKAIHSLIKEIQTLGNSISMIVEQ
ncbi:hypothetical protein ABPG72_000228 [Tetrahymena utriculariae]